MGVKDKQYSCIGVIFKNGRGANFLKHTCKCTEKKGGWIYACDCILIKMATVE